MKSISEIKQDSFGEWKIMKIGEIAQVNAGQGAPQGDKWYNGEKNIFVKAGDLNKLTMQKYVGDYCLKISEDAVKEYNLKLYPENSIVFPKSGMSVMTGNIALLKYDSYVVNHLAIIEIEKKDECIPEYLFYLLKRVGTSNLSFNDSYPSIRLTDINKFKIVIPPLETQKKIVEILEKAEKLKEWRAESDELADEFLKSVFLDMFGDPVKNPKGWPIKKLKEFGEIKTGNTPSRKKQDYYGDYIEWIKSDNINTPFTFLTESEEKLSKKGAEVGRIVPKGSVLVTCIAGSVSCIGNVAITDREVAFNQQINSITPKNSVNELFLYHLILISQNYIQRFSTQALKGIINKKSFESLNFIYPPVELQNKFGKIALHVETLKTHQKQSKQQINNLFNSLMQKAFKGELTC